MEGKKARIFSQVTCGVALGAANSLFGGGGGMIAVPMLQKTGLQEKNAHATAILLILPVSLLSFIFYVFRGFYDPNVLIPTAIGVAAGGLLGAALFGKMSVKKVSLLFSILQAAAGIFLLFFH